MMEGGGVTMTTGTATHLVGVNSGRLTTDDPRDAQLGITLAGKPDCGNNIGWQMRDVNERGSRRARRGGRPRFFDRPPRRSEMDWG
jgi:hypothetical protein